MDRSRISAAVAGATSVGRPEGLAAAAVDDVVAVEKGRWTSYSACGIPYVVGGEVVSLDELVARSPQVFRDRFRIDARTEQEAMAIDLDQRVVEVRDHNHKRTYRLGFDLLHIG